MDQYLKLNVGCGSTKGQPGFINCDYMPGPNVDRVFDATKHWPFDNNSVSVVTSYHMLEHITDWQTFFQEMWRVLIPGGRVSLQLPYGPSADGFAELGHLRYWMPTSFCCLQPGYAEGIGNLQHQYWDTPFEVNWVGCRVNPKLHWMLKWPWRKYGLNMLWYLFGGHVELIVGMTVLKTEEAVKEFWTRNPDGLYVPVSQVAWMHEWDPKGLTNDSKVALHNFNQAAWRGSRNPGLTGASGPNRSPQTGINL